MSERLLDGVDLHFVDARSNKVYELRLYEAVTTPPLVWEIRAQYGRLGAGKQEASWTFSSLLAARRKYDAVVKEKTGKGYKVTKTYTGAGKPAAPKAEPAPDPAPAPERAKTSPYPPQLLNPITDNEFAALKDDPAWMAQPKMDGERVQVEIMNSIPIGFNRKGIARELPAAVQTELAALPDCFLDGELIGDVYHAFDMLGDVAHLPAEARHERLRTQMLLSFAIGKHVKLVPAALTSHSKLEMYLALTTANAEGMVFKRKAAAYSAGRPASGGDQLKLKFVESASVIVSGISEGVRSVSMDLIDNGARVAVGKVTIPPNYPVPEIGDVVEVQYLYAYKGGSLYQPVYRGKRSDIDQAECVLQQLKYKVELQPEESSHA